MASNYYHFLGVEKNADTTTIRTTYRKLAKESHPDLNRHDPHAEAYFKRINEAYEVLSDPVKRRNYDLTLIKEPEINTSDNKQTFSNSASSKAQKSTPSFNNKVKAAYFDVLMKGTKKQSRYKLSEILYNFSEMRWQDFPATHHVILGVLAFPCFLLSIWSVIGNDLFTIMVCWLFFVTHTLISSYWLNEIKLTAIKSKTINWLGVLMAHMLVLPISIILCIIITPFLVGFLRISLS